MLLLLSAAAASVEVAGMEWDIVGVMGEYGGAVGEGGR